MIYICISKETILRIIKLPATSKQTFSHLQTNKMKVLSIRYPVNVLKGASKPGVAI